MKTQIKLEGSPTPKDNKTPNFYFLVLISITANHNNRRLRSAPTIKTEPKKKIFYGFSLLETPLADQCHSNSNNPFHRLLRLTVQYINNNHNNGRLKRG